MAALRSSRYKEFKLCAALLQQFKHKSPPPYLSLISLNNLYVCSNFTFMDSRNNENSLEYLPQEAVPFDTDENFVVDCKKIIDDSLMIKTNYSELNGCNGESKSLEVGNGQNQTAECTIDHPKMCKDTKLKCRLSQKNTNRKSKSVNFAPTHCLALRIRNRKIHQEITRLKNAMENIDNQHGYYFLPMSSLRINLLLMVINSEGKVNVVNDALQASLPEIAALLPSTGKTLEFKSISRRGESVFLNASGSDGLEYLKVVINILRDALHKKNIDVKQGLLKPRALVMKRDRKKSSRGASTELFKVHSNDYFGKEDLNELVFCSMVANRGDSHQVFASLNIQEAKLNRSDESARHTHDAILHSEGETLKQEAFFDSDNDLIMQGSRQKKGALPIRSRKRFPSYLVVREADKRCKLAMNIDQLDECQGYISDGEEHEKESDLVFEEGECNHLHKDSSDIVKTELPNPEKAKKKKRNKRLPPVSSDELKETRKLFISRPTHFLCFRIYNSKIHEKVKELQDSVLRENENFKCSFIKIPTLHITIALLSLTDDNELGEAIKALILWSGKLNAVEKILEFSSLCDFRGQVLFIDVKKTGELDNLKRMVSDLKKFLYMQDVRITKDKFTPHVTVMKLSKCYKFLKKKGIKKIPSELYQNYKSEYFGQERVKELLLCSMTGEKEVDGFYQTLAKIDLVEGKITASNKNKASESSDLSQLNNLKTRISFTDGSVDENDINNPREMNNAQENDGISEKNVRNAIRSDELSNRNLGDSWMNISIEYSGKSGSSWDEISDDEVEIGKLSTSDENDKILHNSNEGKETHSCTII